MRAGDRVGERFRLGRLAGTGGMGEVFEGLDETTGERVAVKSLPRGDLSQHLRFEREAQVLAELSDPGIVRYVTHAMTPAGEPYIVMEWLRGEDLRTRLARQRLAVDEALVLGERIARAVAAAHTRGIVHRDLKPSNVFLVEGRLDQVKVFDFGIAHLGDATRLTHTGTAMGTPAYMSPEQARGEGALTPRADVFAMGCILFECLTGAPAFRGDQALAVLARILFGEVPRLSTTHPTVPETLSALVSRMLARDPDHRPPDGSAVAAALAAIAAGNDDLVQHWMHTPEPAPALTRGERRVLSVVLIERASMPPATDTGVTVITDACPPELRAAAEAFGGRLEVLPEGSTVVAIGGSLVATDQAALAARCALAMRAAAPGRAMALATGRAEGSLLAGEVVDRAVDTLSHHLSLPPGARREPRPIALDELTAHLLDGRFDVRDSETGHDLHGEREVTTGTRRLLGKPTSCVGRGRELSILEGIFDDCVQDELAQVALVTAPAGMGKSRLLHELLTMVNRHQGLRVWVGRGGPLRTGSAFSLLGQALRSAAGILDGEPLAVRQAKLEARVARHVPQKDQERVAAFLGEIIGTPLSDEGRPALRAARREAAIMAEEMRLAWQDFLRAETFEGPVLLVLDDLHWGDLPTVRFVDAALSALRDRPWMVLALARPEVHELFPRLWETQGCCEINLRALSAKDSARLAQQVLGADVDADLLARMVQQADGNPFYLEELIRAAAEHGDTSLPGSVVAMVHARLARLEDEHRRVLRAASVFGEVFWAGGVAALVGSALGAAGVSVMLEALVEREVVVRRPESRFVGEEELAFRHMLLREGAYAMLTEDDRPLGHRLAAEWLEAHGESDPRVLAEHHDRGEDPARAGGFYLRAAERALRAGDMAAAVARAERALACGVEGEGRSTLLAILAEASLWQSRWPEAGRYAEEVMRAAPPGSAAWARAAVAKLGFAQSQGDVEAVAATTEAALAAEPGSRAVSELACAINFGCFILASRGRFASSRAALARLHEIVEPVAAREPIARGWMHTAHANAEALANEDPWAGAVHAERARASFLEVGHRTGAALALMKLGMNLWFLGALAQAEQALASALESGEDTLGSSTSLLTFCLAGVLADAGRLDEAHRRARQKVELWSARHLPSDEGRARAALADVLHRLGEREAAAKEARAAVALLRFLPLEQAAARARLAGTLCAEESAGEALAAASEAQARCEALGSFGFRGGVVLLAHVEALSAAGDEAQAASALAAARARILAQRAKIGDRDLAQSFVHGVPENARILALARERLGEP